MGQLVPRQIPTLFGGVSRQPNIVRQPNQVEEGKNALFSVVTGGFEKRPASQFIAEMTTLDNTVDYKVHAIDRDNTEQLFVLLSPEGEILVFDSITGAAKTVNIGDSTRYFLVEIDQIDSTGRISAGAAPDSQAFGYNSQDEYPVSHSDTVFAWGYKLSDAASVFKVEGSVDGTTWNNIATGKTGASGNFNTTVDAVATGDHNFIRFDMSTAAASSSDTLTVFATFKDKTYLSIEADGPEDFALVTVADFTFIANRNHVARLAEADAGTVTDTARATVLDVPPAGLVVPTGTGNIFKIIQDDNEFTTFYVIDDTVENLYLETANPNAHNAFDASSLPHQLVREADGTFTFSESTWAARTVGDEDITKAPDFMNGTVSDVVFFRERLGFLAGESVYLTRAGDPLNLWPEKAVATLDTDPIERTARTTDVNLLKFGTVFRKLLFTTSERAQFELSALDAFTPGTAAYDEATRYPASPVAKPQAMGDVLYFPSSGQNFTTMYEYFFDETSLSNTASDVTKHILDYLPNDVLQLATDTQTGTMFVLTTGAQNKIFVYRTFFDGNDKIQSAWSEYILGATEADAFVHGIAVFSGFLVYLVERQDGNIYMEQMPIEREAADPFMGFIPLIDQRELLTGVYDATNDCTTWTPTWDHADDAEVVLGPNFTGDDIGRRMTVLYPDEYTLTLATVLAGEILTLDDGTTSLDFTAHATVTTTANREFDISGNDTADAGELVTVINDLLCLPLSLLPSLQNLTILLITLEHKVGNRPLHPFYRGQLH